MTTVTPTHPTVFQLNATLTSPFHHGAGSAGNTSLLRTHDVVQPDGHVARVPFLSAASLRHALRNALAWETARLIDLQPASLTKSAVDLLFTGGAVSSTGAKTDLDMMRRVEEHFPALAMLGYAAKSDIITGTMWATDLILVCAENADRLDLTDTTLKPAAHFRSEEFGTRHDQAATPAGKFIEIATGELTTAQMIWDTQVLISGSRLVGEVSLTPAATEAHRTALGAALHLWAPDGHTTLGAKNAQGFGHADITIGDSDSFDGSPDFHADYQQWAKHTEEHAEDIRALLAELG
ncbi:TPA: hypothetical protein I8W35_002319 [Corynebacterium striatum]|nr:hypothetical protein [Corynebacterium striatum]HAT1405403.1 hypothetical protein [Corynebacterium striatum]